MSLDKFVIKYLTLKRLIFLIVIAIYTCNYERTSKPALFFKKDIDYGGDNLAIDPSMIKHYNLQKESRILGNGLYLLNLTDEEAASLEKNRIVIRCLFCLIAR